MQQPFEKDDRSFALPRNGRGAPDPDKGKKVKKVFSDLNRKFEEEETQRKAKTQNLPYFDLTGFPIEQHTLALVPKEDAKEAGAVVFHKDGSTLRIGAVDPHNEKLAKVIKMLEKRSYTPQLHLVSRSGLVDAHAQYRKVIEPTSVETHEVRVKTGNSYLNTLKTYGKYKERILSVSVTEIINTLAGAAVGMRASDIHLEPEDDHLTVRFRIDGVLQDIVRLPLVLHQRLLSRIKLLARLKLNVTNKPQDGRFTIEIDAKEVEVRVSVLPTGYGESVVMRLLGMQEVDLNLEDLGLRGEALKVVYREIKKPNGMILTTGPTGSGKTTTLYACLNYLNKPGIKIITLEDPVEYQLEGITQTPIERNDGIDFAGALHTVLRQDPDIIMVGEIRDFETAETAAQAALTGHVVLSTMHTNDAAGAIPRMLDLGIKPVTLAPALNVLVAQRLVRRLCQECKTIYRSSNEEMQRVQAIFTQMKESGKHDVPERVVFYHSKGCPACNGLGYRGRIGVFEAFAVDDAIEDLIFKQASRRDIQKAAIAQGMLTMQQDGILKALEGITDLAEVWRVTEE